MWRILTVDDDEGVRRMISLAGKKAGYDVVEASDGVEGLAKAHSLAPNLIVLDISMPKLDGRDVLRELRANPTTRALPVVMFTSRDTHLDRIAGLKLGADDYVEKPFDVIELFRVIERRLRKASEPGTGGEGA